MSSKQQTEFVKTVERYQGIINNLCHLYYSNIEDQKDARQDIILQLWKSFPSFREESSRSTWIYRVSLNTILAKIRKQNRRITTAAMDKSTAQQVFVQLGVDDDIQLLRSIIESLKADDKALVILYLEGYKNKEIATMLEISTSNVSTRLYRIKAQLKDQFKKLSHATK
ncbi:MAG: RNA polymerase sigma factor [Bacteroidota bacterium]